MSDTFVGLLVLGIFLGYFVLGGFVYGLLPEYWADHNEYANCRDNWFRGCASIFWPITGPFFLGAILSSWAKTKQKSTLPQMKVVK